MPGLNVTSKLSLLQSRSLLATAAPPTLTLGSDLLTNGDMELDANWSDSGTPTTNARSSEQHHGDEDSNTKLLLHCDGADTSTSFADSSLTPKTVTPAGTAQVDTDQSKFGGAALLVDGDSDYLSVADHDDLNLGTGAFTIDFWFRDNGSTGLYSSLFSNGYATWQTGAFRVGYNNTGNASKVTVYWNPDDPVITSTNTFATATWHHVAVVRETTTSLKLYVNGALEGSATVDAGRTIDLTANGECRIGTSTWDGADGYFKGWIDELRISKGSARWTAAFTPPTAAYKSFSRKVVSDAAAEGIQQTYGSFVVNSWYQLLAWVYNTSAATARFGIEDIFASDVAATQNAWTQLSQIARINSGASHAVRLAAVGSGETLYYDDATLKAVTFATMLAGGGDAAARYGTYKFGVTVDDDECAGGVCCLDSAASPAYYLLAYIDRLNDKAYLLKCDNGTVTELVGTAATYVAGTNVEVRIVAGAAGLGGAQVGLWYNGTQVGTTQTVDLQSYGTLVRAFDTSEGATVTVRVEA